MPIIRHTHSTRTSAFLAAFLLLSMFACRTPSLTPSAQGEYIQDPNPETAEPFCKWQEDPTPPDGMVAHRIGVGFPIDDEHESCEAFAPDEVDEHLIEKYKSSVVDGCNPEPFELLRGCYNSPYNGERCLFSAYFFSSCPLSTSE